MRTLAVLASLTVLAAPAAAQHNHGQPAAAGQHGAAGHGHAVVPGWQFRLDRASADRNAVHFMQMGNGIHFHAGPSGIFYNPEHTRTGAYRLTASFRQTRAPEHPEAYGLFFGAQNLDQPNQDYMYFVVRGGGQFTVKHRAGDEVHTIADWTDHAAINKQNAQGQATNELAVDVTAEAITYFVNGQEVYRINRPAVGHGINTNGVYGLRVNHNLDVHVEGPTATGG